jgi:hypothetical protein
MFSIRTCFAVDGACWRCSPSSSLSNNLYIVIAQARFCAHAGAPPVAHACSERQHAPATARMREGIKSLSPSPPFPLDPFLSGKVGGGSAARSKNAAAGEAALDPCPRSGPRPAASAGGGGGGCSRGHPPARGAWVCPAAASAGPTTWPVSGTRVRLLPAKKRPRLAWLAVFRPRSPRRAFSCCGGGTVDNAEGCKHG